MEKVVEYEVRCFDRTMTIEFDEPVNEEEVLKYIENAYNTWHDPEGCDSYEEELAIVSTPCEEYIASYLEDNGYSIASWKSIDNDQLQESA